MPAFTPSLAIFDVGGPEIMIILLVTLLLFGSERLPELARNMGKSMREFKKAASSLEEEFKRAIEVTPSPPPKPPPSSSDSSAPASPPPSPPSSPDKPSPPSDDYPYPQT